LNYLRNLLKHQEPLTQSHTT